MSQETTVANHFRIFTDIDLLRKEEGDSVSILCDDPEAETIDVQTAVEVCGFWTDWEEKRFYGRTWVEALTKAADACRDSQGDMEVPGAPQIEAPRQWRDEEYENPESVAEAKQRIKALKGKKLQIETQLTVRAPLGRLASDKYHEYLVWRKKALVAKMYVEKELAFLKSYLSDQYAARAEAAGKIPDLVRIKDLWLALRRMGHAVQWEGVPEDIQKLLDETQTFLADVHAIGGPERDDSD